MEARTKKNRLTQSENRLGFRGELMEFNHSLVSFLFSRFLLVGLFSFLVQKKENSWKSKLSSSRTDIFTSPLTKQFHVVLMILFRFKRKRSFRLPHSQHEVQTIYFCTSRKGLKIMVVCAKFINQIKMEEKIIILIKKRVSAFDAFFFVSGEFPSFYSKYTSWCTQRTNPSFPLFVPEMKKV
jgi:hypothetical protein